jgi:hypothetical protein
LMKYTGSNAQVLGTFSGTIYEDNDALDEQCKMPIAHSIGGGFWLMVAPK